MSNGNQAFKEENCSNDRLEKFQKSFNNRHLFGIRIWKPALYEKHRSIEGNTYYDLHSYPLKKTTWGEILKPANVLWTLLFGIWIGLGYILVSLTIFLPICLVAAFGARILEICGVKKTNIFYNIAQELCLFGKCARCIIDAGIYFIYPFGCLVKIRECSVIPDNGFHGRREDESQPLLQEELNNTNNSPDTETNGEEVDLKDILSTYNEKRVFIYVYRTIYGSLLFGLNLLAAVCCMFLIFFIPMTQLNTKIGKTLLKCPFAVKFQKFGNDMAELDVLPFTDNRNVNFNDRSLNDGCIIDTALCVKSAAGRLYYKHTIKGINIIFVNLMFVVAYSLIDYYGVRLITGNHFSGDGVLFTTSLISIIPISYLIGMTVAFITSETGSLALGAVINATFGSIIEIILYMLAIINNEQKIVEGAIIGTLLASLLALPGLSMMFGSLCMFEQKFSSRLAGITCTTLIGAISAAFLPTILQSTYGSYSIICTDIPGETPTVPPTYYYTQKKKLYKQQGCTILRESLYQDTFYTNNSVKLVRFSSIVLILIYIVGLYFTLTTPSSNFDFEKTFKRRNLNNASHSRKLSTDNNKQGPSSAVVTNDIDPLTKPMRTIDRILINKKSIFKSLLLLLTSTVVYSFIAEIIVTKISSGVFDNINISPKMTGLSLFSIIPMSTEFYNAISFAMNRNIALGLEIGSAYMAQTLMIQIPVLVFFSYFFYNINPSNNSEITNFFTHKVPNMGFTMIFSNWDIYVCLFGCWVFLRVYSEGKSNFFKGAVLFLTYLIIIASYLLVPSS